MTLAEGNTGDRLKIGKLQAEQSLVQRLRALGLGEGEHVELVRVSRRRTVYFVRTAFSSAALGAETARMIGVET